MTIPVLALPSSFNGGSDSMYSASFLRRVSTTGSGGSFGWATRFLELLVTRSKRLRKPMSENSGESIRFRYVASVVLLNRTSATSEKD